jgi:hypothetical protein
VGGKTFTPPKGMGKQSTNQTNLVYEYVGVSVTEPFVPIE